MTLPNKADIESYGGAKMDYHPVEDPTTDRAANEVNELACDTAMLTRTAFRAYVKFTTHASAPTVVEHDAMWGNANGVMPVVSAFATGVYDVTWPANVTDQLGVSYAVSLFTAISEADAGTAFKHVHCTRLSARVVRVKVLDNSHAADGTAGLNIKVFAL